MWFVVATASAADFPWECTGEETPEEVRAWEPGGGLYDTWVAMDAAARVWVDEGCEWVEGGESRTCDTAAGAHVVETAHDWLAGDGESGGAYVELEVTPPDGAETWSSLVLRTTDSWSNVHSSSTTSDSTAYQAAWVGAFGDLPESGAFYNQNTTEYGGTISVGTPGCVVSWEVGPPEVLRWGADSAERVLWLQSSTCEDTQAWWLYESGEGGIGAVDPETWAGLIDADTDGWTEEQGDCDDADPSRYPCAPAVEGVVDPACTSTDADGDGWWTEAASEGEVDCDDADPSVHPGGAEVGCDDIDQDCDGQDLREDADGDGHSDTDCGGDDCDDTDTTVYPGRADNDCDGIDANCDGEDGPFCAEEPGGCGTGGGVWLLLAPLFAVGGRRRGVSAGFPRRIRS